MAPRSTAARSERPMSRWISLTRPPEIEPRGTLCRPDPGSIEYSAVSQPCSEPRSQDGTESSTETVHNTLVPPISTSTEPGVISV